MSLGRSAFLSVLLAVGPATVALGQEDCGLEQVLAYSTADTIFVEHVNAVANCCLELAVEVGVEEFVVDFYESDLGDPCDCICCFILRYEAHGFAAGHYTVRVWDATGTVLHGETEVDVDGPGGAPLLGLVDQGECLEPTMIDEEPIEVTHSWGRVRTTYR